MQVCQLTVEAQVWIFRVMCKSNASSCWHHDAVQINSVTGNTSFILPFQQAKEGVTET
jgi:hypothetical protein